MSKPTGEEVFPDVWRIRLALFAAALLVGWVLWAIQGILGTFALAWLVAYILYPGVALLERRGASRTGAVAILVLGVGAVFSIAAALVVPVLISETLAMARTLPDWAMKFEESLRASQILAGLPPGVAEALRGAIARGVAAAQASLPELGPALGRALWDAVWNAFGSVLGVLGGILNLLLFATIVIYLLFDFPEVNEALLSFVPRRHRDASVTLLNELDVALKTVLRGQLGVAIAYGAILSIGWSIVGLDFAFFIGMSSGFANFIPYVGPIGGMGIALVVGLFQAWGTGLGPVLLHLLFIALVGGTGQLIESFLLTPYLAGRSVGLGPIAVMFAMTVGGAIGGVLGVLFALPGAVVVKILLTHLVRSYRESEFFRG